jgi:hypothetical protein
MIHLCSKKASTETHVKFSFLFGLSIDNSITVVEMKRQGWGADGQQWRWRRRLFSWEEKQLADYVSVSKHFLFAGQCCG